MKLLLLAENWPPRVGGIENYLTNVVRQLTKLKHEVKVVEPSGQRFFWPVIKPAWLPLYWSLRKQAKRGDFQLMLCGKALFEGLAAFYLKKKLGVPYVVFTYAMEIEEWTDDRRNLQKLERVLWNADRVVYINEETKRLLIDLGVQEKQLLKMWPGVSARYLVETPDADIAAVRKKYKLKQPYVIGVARLIERKGFKYLIEAFSHLDQIRFDKHKLVIVGDGPEAGELKKFAEQMFVDTSVRFLGLVPDADLSALYSGAEVFALTPQRVGGDTEGFGIVYLEAAGQGLAALATKTGGVPEAVLNGETGILVPPNDVMAGRDGLNKLLSDKGLREKLGKQGRRRVLNEFRWKDRIKPLGDELEKVVSEK